MKRYILILLVLISVTNLFSQDNVLIEFKYLQLVNAQGDKDLAEDNYRNAEIICDSIIINSHISEVNAHMFFELAKSYELNEEYGLMAFSLLRQRCLAPNDSFNIEGQRLFEEACLRLQLTHKQARLLYYNTETKNITKNNYPAQLSILYQNSILLFDASVDAKLMKYYSLYNTQKLEIDYMHQQWQFLTMIDLGMKKKKRILSQKSVNSQKEYWEIEDNKLHKRVLMRAEHYYRKSDANAEAKYYLEEYKKLELSVFNKIQRSWRLLLN
ncbi:MAG: hypothetical protein B6I18_06325 [Bacteroidetes bacterium 4572_112]|nr:MAG: hypothetical protein B6I18_06325 [Bacteroidetes bacterium 4572_112]